CQHIEEPIKQDIEQSKCMVRMLCCTQKKPRSEGGNPRYLEWATQKGFADNIQSYLLHVPKLILNQTLRTSVSTPFIEFIFAAIVSSGNSEKYLMVKEKPDIVYYCLLMIDKRPFKLHNKINQNLIV
ncbi:hypothetical protein ACJX0J_035214, partial [Zea mays]